MTAYINSGNYVAHSYFGTNPVYTANPDSGSWAQHQTSVTKTYTSPGTQYAALVFYTSYWATADTMEEDCSVTIAAAPAPLPMATTFSVSDVGAPLDVMNAQSSITTFSGGSVDLHYGSAHVTGNSCIISDESNQFSKSVTPNTSGAVTVGPLTANKTYYFYCYDSNGNTSIPKSVYVQVTSAPTGCTNGATNYPTCTLCTAPQTMVNGVCTTLTTGCTNGATNYPTCTLCTAPQTMVNGTCTTPTAPDLTASAVSPSAATAGVAVSLSATISNIGTASTGAGFTNLFQSASDANGTGAADIGTSLQSGALAAGGTAVASLSHTFTSAGTYYIRACADKSSAGNAGVITESNENNNCGAWTPITVSVPACPNGAANPPSCDQCPNGQAYVNGVCTACGGTGCGGAGGTPTNPLGGLTCNNGANNPIACDAFTPEVTLTANPSFVDQGQSSSLSWNSTHADNCSIPGLVPSGGASGGPVSTGALNTAGTVSFQITCTGPGGTGYGSASVGVYSPAASISADPLRVAAAPNNTTKLSWSASGVASCSVTSSSGTTLASGPADANHSFTTGSPRSVTVSGQSTYTLSCQTVGGASLTRSVTVNVTPLFQQF